MATTVKRIGKTGRVSYLIRVSDGYSTDGKRIRHSMTWKPEPKWSEKKVQKELLRQTFLFEDRINADISQNGSIKFQEFADKFMSEYAEKQLKNKTIEGYRQRLKRVYPMIGHIRLKDLKTGRLNSLYSDFQADGMNLITGGRLKASSVREYHRAVCSVLSKAVKWGYIPFNPAKNADLPKIKKTEATYLDEKDTSRLLTLLQNEPAKYRTAIIFDLMSGLRRGELLGLRWQDVDFDSQTISVAVSSLYTGEHGYYTDTPKNQSSARVIKLSHSVFSMLMKHKSRQTEQRNAHGANRDENSEKVFTHEDGRPISPICLSAWFKKFIMNYNFPNIKLHSLRHTYASLLLANGTSLPIVSKRLGHSQVSTTSDIYAHVIKSADEKAANITEMFSDAILTDVI